MSKSQLSTVYNRGNTPEMKQCPNPAVWQGRLDTVQNSSIWICPKICLDKGQRSLIIINSPNKYDAYQKEMALTLEILFCNIAILKTGWCLKSNIFIFQVKYVLPKNSTFCMLWFICNGTKWTSLDSQGLRKYTNYILRYSLATKIWITLEEIMAGKTWLIALKTFKY